MNDDIARVARLCPLGAFHGGCHYPDCPEDCSGRERAKTVPVNPFEDYPLALQYAGTAVQEIGMAMQRRAAGDDIERAHRELAIDAVERLLRCLKKIRP